MRAVQITEFGGLDVLKVADVDTPEPGDGEVLIRVEHAGINFADTHQRENSYLARFELPLVPGGEVAGVDPGAEDLTEALVEANGGKQVDVVLEMAGGRVFDACLKALAPFGRLVTYGIAGREPNEVQSGRLMRRSRGVIGFWLMHLLARPEMLRGSLEDLLAR